MNLFSQSARSALAITAAALCLAVAAPAQTGAMTSGAQTGAYNTGTDAAAANAAQQTSMPAPTMAGSLGAPLPAYLVPTTDMSILYPPARDFHLNQGDTLTVHLFDESDYTSTATIDSKGAILLPFLGEVPVAGLTIPEAQLEIARLLREAGLYTDPQVTLTVAEGPNSSIIVTGAAHMLLPTVTTRTLFEVLSAANAFTSTASHVITITRPGVAQPIVVDLGPDPASSPEAHVPLFPGDVVTVARAGVVYILGSFKTQGIVPLSGDQPMTLIQLASITGGPTQDANFGDLHLIRTINGRRQFVTVDIKKIIKGKAPDPILQAGDIIYLPPQPVKDFLLNGNFSVALQLVNLALLAFTINR